ncbi:MAG: hypothetical protein QXP98_00090 [Thermoproteus sp.]
MRKARDFADRVGGAVFLVGSYARGTSRRTATWTSWWWAASPSRPTVGF